MHMVMFTNADGRPATHTADSLEEAVKFIEHIRNNEAVADARLFHMTEVPLEMKAYYRVEVSTPAAPPAAAGESTLSVSEASDTLAPSPGI